MGDIMAIDSLGQPLIDRLVIECKRYKSADVLRFIAQDSGLVRDWWDTVCLQASCARKTPCLILKEDRRPIVMVLPNAQTSVFHNTPFVGYEVIDFEALLRKVSFALFVGRLSNDYLNAVEYAAFNRKYRRE